MEFPKISIVTTNLNGGQFLERTILSVLNQGYPNLEYIIIDGGSTDNSLDIIQQYESRLHCWLSEPDNGMYDAIQKGFNLSSGEIMGWLNSDDILLNNALFTLAELFHNNPSIEWLEGVNCLINKGDSIFKIHLPVHHFKRRYLLNKNYLFGPFAFIQQESTYWRRTLWNKAGGSLNTQLKCAGDFELWIRFFNYAVLYKVDTLIGAFRVSGTTQKSVVEKDVYLSEVSSIVQAQLNQLSFKERFKIFALGFLLIFFKAIPFLGSSLVSRLLDKLDDSRKVEYCYSSRHFKV